MKTYRLSTPAERILGIAICVTVIPLMGLLLYVLRSDVLMLVMLLLGVILISAGLIFYVLSVTKAALVYDSEKQELLVRSFPSDYRIDLTKAATLETRARQVGHTASRALVFTDAEGLVVASVATYFTTRQGVRAEPLAIEMAADMGLAFQANLKPWEYDKEKRKEHEKELEEIQRKESKERREAKIRYLRKKLLSRAAGDKPQSAAAEEMPNIPKNSEDTVPAVNYDAMDDDK